jgi:hypothetical protein
MKDKGKARSRNKKIHDGLWFDVEYGPRWKPKWQRINNADPAQFFCCFSLVYCYDQHFTVIFTDK